MSVRLRLAPVRSALASLHYDDDNDDDDDDKLLFTFKTRTLSVTR